MSEVSDIFDFRKEDGGLDIDAIFGKNEDVTDPAPVVEELPVLASNEKQPEEAEAETTSQQPLGTDAAAESKTEESDPQAEPDLFSVFSASETESEAPSKDAAAVITEKPVSIFDQPPVFSYGGAKEPIKDASLTFEELRIQKADDFPELAEGKKVSWSVKYGDVTKSVLNPKESTIAKVKEEIEKSKAFLDSLKKGKVKDPKCLVMPRVTAGSKGIASYKGFFPTIEAARSSDKIINLIPASDGRIYELRKTEMGEFVTPKNKIKDLSEVRAGFIPALPLIPRELMGQLISFFRSFMGEGHEFEALAFIYWDRQEEQFVLYIPKQTSSKAYIGFRVEEALPEERYLHYADIHSHNSMAAKFSPIDDADEKATRLYLVVGRLDRFYPQITARVSCGGTFLEIDPASVIEGIGEEFPTEWLDRVERVSSEDYFGLRDKKMQRALGAMFR